jgi:hypothetical protein
VSDPEVDQYRACETGRCGHDLARAVGVAELWGGDGPFAPQPVIALTTRRPVRFADDAEPAVQQRWAV